MSARALLRVALSVIIIGLVWFRAIRGWRYESRWWLAGSLVLSVLLILVVVSELFGVRKKWSRMREDVPKRPLGLE